MDWGLAHTACTRACTCKPRAAVEEEDVPVVPHEDVISPRHRPLTSTRHVHQSTCATLLLRPQLMFPRTYIYYIAIAIDLVLRFAWILTFTQVKHSPLGEHAAFYVNPFLATAELIRRTGW